MDIPELRKISGASAAVAAAPQCGWPERGMSIYGGPSVGITCHHDYDDISGALFTGWNGRDFNYCPSGEWTQWVALAKRILEIDALAGKSPTA